MGLSPTRDTITLDTITLDTATLGSGTLGSATRDAGREAGAARLPYGASWINRLTAWVDARPGPAWCYYLAGLLAAAGLPLAIAAGEGVYRPQMIGFAAVFMGSSVYYLALIHYLDRIAAGAFAEFGPAMGIAEQPATDLNYALTHLPAAPVRLLTLVGLVCALGMIAGTEQGAVAVDSSYFGTSTPAQLYWRAALIADQMLFRNLLYHTVHQLRIVNLIYTQHAKIDIFNLSPLYKLSRLAACTAVGTILIAYLWLATYPWMGEDYLVMGSWLLGILAAGAGFVLPLLGIHRRLVEEKQRWKVEAGQWLKTCLSDFHATIAERKLEEIDAQLKMIEGVQREQALLDQIPTWPWQPGTVRGLTTTILAPVILWCIMRVLEHFLAF